LIEPFQIESLHRCGVL